MRLIKPEMVEDVSDMLLKLQYFGTNIILTCSSCLLFNDKEENKRTNLDQRYFQWKKGFWPISYFPLFPRIQSTSYNFTLFRYTPDFSNQLLSLNEAAIRKKITTTVN